MRPYLAIIKDSFRAAMASRVLYVLLLLITLLLLAIAPFHVRETLDWELSQQSSVRNPAQLIQRIVERHTDERDKPIGRIWEMLPEETRTQMTEIAERQPAEGVEEDPDDQPGRRNPPRRSREDRQFYGDLVDDLNDIIEDPDFYRPEDWENRMVSTEAEGLINQGVENLSELRMKRLNRLLISTAVAPSIDTGNSTALDFYYAIWRFPITASITHQQFAQVFTAELPVYFDKFVMSIGLLIAIVITANMIPETFEPGSLNLLLSKPISRWGLYTAKFVGGCVFIALCAGYLFIGVWLWMGLGMQIWDRAMLLSIPLYVIVFAIYFSVSTLVGLIWRSAIVSVILTLLFWATCFTVGSVYGVFHTKMENSEIISLVSVGDRVFSNDVIHQFRAWDPKKRQWDNVLGAEMGQEGDMVFGINSYFVPFRSLPGDLPALPGIDLFLAPVYEPQSGRIIASRYEMDFGGSKKQMFVADEDKLVFKPVGNFPRDTYDLFSTASGIVAVASDGSFYRLDQQKFDAAFQNADSMEQAERAVTYFDELGKPKTGAKVLEDAQNLMLGPDQDVGNGNSEISRDIATKFAQAVRAADKSTFRDSDQSIVKLESAGVYCELQPGRAALLMHVPQYKKLTSQGKKDLAAILWSVAAKATAAELKPDDRLAVGIRGNLGWGAVMVGTPAGSQPAESSEGELLEDFFQPPTTALADQSTQKPALAENLFSRIGPEDPVAIRSAQLVDYSQTRDEFAFYQRGIIKTFHASGDGYKQQGSLELSLGFESKMTCRLAYQGDTIVLAFGNGKVITVTASTLQEKNEYQVESRSAIEQVHGSASGRYFAVLYRNGNLWILDTENDSTMHKADVTGQGEVCAVTFAGDQLLVADNTDRASEYDLLTGKQMFRHSPSGGWMEQLYRIGLRPFYQVCPKPGEFYKVVTHLSSSGDTEANESVDLNQSIQAHDPWAPLWSGLAFMLVMLFLGCLYFQFKDF